MIVLIKALILFLQVSFYNLQVTTTDNSPLSLSQFRDKKVLIVNIASESPRNTQLAALQSLKNRFGDSLVILAMPSNSFGHEPLSDSDIKLSFQPYNNSIILLKKEMVTGPQANTLYQWLASKIQNKYFDIILTGDFEKILVDETGEIIGIFSPLMEPLSPRMIQSISTH